MVKQLLFIGLVFLLFLTACKDEPVLVKEDEPPNDPNKEPEIVEEQQDDDDEVDEFIEFTLPDEKIKINLNMVPILDEYLHAANDRQQVIKKMDIKRVSVTNHNLYLLKFSCQNNLCSYMVLDQTKDNQAYLIADLAKMRQPKISPEETKVLFHFDRNNKSPVPTSDVVVIDLEKWETVTLVNQMNDKALLNYKTPILTAEWKDDETISVTVPDVDDMNLQQWNKSDKPTEQIDFFLSSGAE